MAGRNHFLYGAVLSANLAAFYCGATFSWSSPVIPLLRSNDTTINPVSKPVSILEETWVASILMIGCLVTALGSGIFSEQFGRKKTLIGFSLCLLISYIMLIFSSSIRLFLIARVIMGFGTGCIISTLPSYVGEIAEDSIRGVSGAMFGISLSLGHLLNYAVGPFISFTTLNILHMVPILLFYLTFLPFVPESPYYFISVNNIEEATKSLRKLRGSRNIEKELEVIENIIHQAKTNKCSFKDMFKSKAVLKGLIIACGVLGIQQLSGVCAIQAYLQPIFDASDGFIPAKFSVLITGTMPLVGNIISTFLIEKLGRKVLLITSSTGSAVSLFFLGVYFYLVNNNHDVSKIQWLPIITTIMFVITVNIGLCAIPWLINGEVFASDVKSVATGLTTSFNLLLSFAAIAAFPSMSVFLGMAGAIWVFVGFLVLGVIFIIFLVPETKGKNLQEIQNILIGKSGVESTTKV